MTSILALVTDTEIAKPILLLWLFNRVLIYIMALFMVGIILNLTQVLVALFFVFLDYSGIDFRGQNIRRLAFLALAQMRIFHSKPTWGLTSQNWFVRYATTTIIVICNRGVGDVFNLKVFFIFRIFYYLPIAMKVVSINFLY